MSRMIKLLFFTVTFLCLTVPVWALSGLRLLTIESGGRPTGMGGAFVAVEADPFSAAFNPAATYGQDGVNGGFSHNTHWQDVAVEAGYISFAKHKAVFTAGMVVGHVEGLQGRTDSVPSSTYYPFDAQDISIKAGVSYQFEKRVVVGAMAGWMMEKIDTYTGSAVNFDIGILYRLRPDLNIGAAVQHFGPTMNLRNEEIDLPTTFRLGGSYRYEKLIGALDLVMFDDSKDDGYDLRVHVGGEYEAHESLLVRAGYRFNYESKSISAGLGFKKRNFRIDYAFLPYSNKLDDSHIFSLTFNY